MAQKGCERCTVFIEQTANAMCGLIRQETVNRMEILDLAHQFKGTTVAYNLWKPH
jgi:hypothetical protein